MLLIKNARLFTMTQGILEKASLLIEDGKITAIGEKIKTPKGCTVLDAEGKTVTPGLIEACGRPGLHEETVGAIGADEDETTEKIGAYLKALDGILPNDLSFQDALEGGVTTVNVCPGTSAIIAGQSAVIHTAGSNIIDRMVLKEPFGLFVNLVGGGNPRQGFRDRSDMVAKLVNELQKAKDFIAKREKALKEGKDAPEAGYRLAPMVDVIEGKLPLIMQVVYLHDIQNALELAEEWGFRLILQRVSEGYFCVENLVKAKVPLMVGPILMNRRGLFQTTSHKTPGVLSKAGLQFALSTEHPNTGIDHLVTTAAIANREGMSEEEALKAITLYPAQILGLDDQIGSLEVGKRADLVVWTGHPFETLTKVETVLIDGVSVYERRS